MSTITPSLGKDGYQENNAKDALDPVCPRQGRIRHLDQTDLAHRWNISPRTLERWRWLNQGPAFLKIGGRVAYRLEDIKAYEVERRHAPEPVRDPFFQGRR